MSTTCKTAQVHRFRDKVAAYLGDGQTAYLTAEEARTFGTALLGVADEIEAGTPFTGSTVGTTSLTFGADA
jgi:hypothetical protein